MCVYACVVFLTETRRKASAWQRNLGYPLAMLSLLSLTVNVGAERGGGLKRLGVCPLGWGHPLVSDYIIASQSQEKE